MTQSPPSHTAGFDSLRNTLPPRRSDERWFGGVCSGLADRFGVDPLIVRAAFVLATLFFGFGLALYLLGWTLMPDSAGRIPLERALYEHDAGSVVLSLVTAVVALSAGPLWAHAGRLGGPGVLLVVLVGVGWWVWSASRGGAPGALSAQRRAERDARAAARGAGRGQGYPYQGGQSTGSYPHYGPVGAYGHPAGPGHPSATRVGTPSPGEEAPAAHPLGPGQPTEAMPSAEGDEQGGAATERPGPPGAPAPGATALPAPVAQWGGRVGDQLNRWSDQLAAGNQAQPATTARPSTPRPSRSRPPRRRSLGLLGAVVSIGIGLVGFGLVEWWAAGRQIHGSTSVLALATALGLIGAVLVVAGLAGRRAGLTGFVAIVLAALTFVTLLVPRDVVDSAHHVTTWTPTSLTAGSSYHFSAGIGVLDLRKVPAEQIRALDGATIPVSGGVGSLRIIVGPQTPLRMRAHAGVGQVDLADSPSRHHDSGGFDVSASTSTGSTDHPLVLRADIGVGDILLERSSS